MSSTSYSPYSSAGGRKTSTPDAGDPPSKPAAGFNYDKWNTSWILQCEGNSRRKATGPMASVTLNGPTNFAASFLVSPGRKAKCSVESHTKEPTTSYKSRRRRFAYLAICSAARTKAALAYYTTCSIACTRSATLWTGQSTTARSACSNGKVGSRPNRT